MGVYWWLSDLINLSSKLGVLTSLEAHATSSLDSVAPSAVVLKDFHRLFSSTSPLYHDDVDL